MVREWLGIVSLREFLSPNFHVLVLCRPRSTLTTYTPEGQGEEEGRQLAPIQSPLNPCSQPWERCCTTPNSTVLFLVSKGLEVSFPLLIPVWLLLRTKAWRKKSTWDLTPCCSQLQMLFLKVYGNHPGSSKHYKKIRNINKLQGKAEVLEWFNTSRLAHHA